MPAPAKRNSAPPKTRATSVPPPRQSARQAAQNCKVPVPQRSTLRLVQGLGLLGPKEQMTKKASEALIRKFDEPLFDDDIAVIAKLTNMDKSALRIAVGLNGPDGIAEEAVV